MNQAPQRISVQASHGPAGPGGAPAAETEVAEKRSTEPIGRTVTKGVLWTVVCAGLNKVVTFVSQIVLAWLLMPEDFGLVAMAMSVGAILSLFSAASLKTLLIQQHDRFDKLAPQVIWLGLILHGCAGALVMAMAPFCAMLFGDDRVTSLILFIGAIAPLSALSMAHFARLAIDLRFGTIARIQLGEGLLYTISAVGLAALGLGPLSLILPQLWVRLYAAAAARLAAGRIRFARPHPAAWWALILPALWIMLYAFLHGLQSQVTNFILGILEDPTVTGLFFWGFLLSVQAAFLLATNLRQVLFPSLTKLNDEPERQWDAFQRSCTVLTSLVAPIVALQILLAEPVIDIFFADHWLAAAPVVRWLSLAMLTLPLNILAVSLLLAWGRFRALAVIHGLQGAMVALGTVLGAWQGGVVSVSIAVAVAMILSHQIAPVLVVRRLRRSLGALLLKLALAAASALPALVVGRLMILATQPLPPIASVILVVVTAVAAWGVFSLLTCPDLRGLLRSCVPKYRDS